MPLKIKASKVIENKLSKVPNVANKDIVLLKNELRRLYIFFSGSDVKKRVEGLKKISSLIEKIYYTDNKRTKVHSFLKKDLQNFYQFLLLKHKGNVNSVPSLVHFLKKFSKKEAVYLLNLYIQTYTIPNVDNEIHYFPKEFHARKIGECDDVAIYANKILSELGIKTKVVEILMDMKFAIATNVGSHAITTYSFNQDGEKYTGFIDNNGVYENNNKYFFKKFLNKTIPMASNFRIIDLAVWKKYRKEQDDPVRRDPTIDSSYYYHRIAIVRKRDALIKLKGLISLEKLFDNPHEDILYFKKNAYDIINRSKLTFSQKKKLARFLFIECGNRLK